MADRAAVAKLLREQAGWCGRLGSPMYAMLLERSADDVLHGGPCWDLLRERALDDGDKGGSALALRFMAGVHRLVLQSRAPDLARHYPSAGGTPGTDDEMWWAFVATVEREHEELRELLGRRCQTNEVGRSAALVGGFLLVASETGLPLRILEVGASAGLNLRWDSFRYVAAEASWGAPNSPVRFDDVYEGDRRPPFEVQANVAERAGCDLHPVDASSQEGRLTLESNVWADQAHRFRLLAGGVEVARRVPADVEQADAADWLDAQLAAPRDGVATVVFHSVVMDQLPLATRTRIRGAIEEAGERASPSAPVAWLRMEGSYSYALLRFLPHEVWLRTWPGGGERKIATTGAHGRPVRWLA